MWHFFDASFVLYFLFRFPARLQLKYFFENRPLTSIKRLNFSELPQSDKHISKKLILDMRAVKKNIINRLQLSKLFTARNNHVRDFTEEQLYNWKNSYSRPLNFPIVRCLPILFIYKLNRLFYCDVMLVFIFICQNNQVLFSDICTCFLRIWNFFASPTKLLIDVNVSHCCEHVNISKAPSRRELQNGPSAKC